MREIRIAGRDEIIVAGMAPGPSTPKLARVALPSVLATAAVAVALAVFRVDPAAPPTDATTVQVSVEAPDYDLASGKVANRLGGAKGASTLPIHVSTAGLFGHWLDRSVPVVPAAQEGVAKGRPPSRIAASLGEAGVTVAARAEPAGEPSRLLGFVPSDLLSSPRTALNRVASLGDAILERVVP
jgi:hypothetical protein